MDRDELFGQDHENQEGEGRPVPTDWDGVDAPKSDFTDSAEAQASEQFNAADEEATGSPRPEYRAQAKGAGQKSGGAGTLIAAALAGALAEVIDDYEVPAVDGVTCANVPTLTDGVNW